MIKEIIKLRGDGLSFRKIAVELNTTVGKVQYRWNKWLDNNQEQDVIQNENVTTQEELEPSVNPTTHTFNPKGELQIKLKAPRKVMLTWEVSHLPRKIIHLFFNQKFEDLVQVVRIYDVTDIMFTGKNAHHFHEISIPFNMGHWIIKGLVPNRSYIAELGVHISENEFFPILRSNSVQLPMAEDLNEYELCEDYLPIQQFDIQPPKWTDHVSTYSYYGKSNSMGDNNG